MDILGDDEMEQIQATMNNFIAYNNVVRKPKHTWIPDDGPINNGGFNMFKIKDLYQGSGLSLGRFAR